MSLTPAIIDAMVAGGCTAEQLAAVFKADFKDRQKADEERRAKDAERQRRHRLSRNVTVTECDVAESPPLSRPPNENNSNPPTHTPEKQTRARKGHRLPIDWEPQPLTGDTGTAVDGWPPGAQERELARFKDWAASASGPNAVKSDWQAAWRNWVRKAHDEGRYAKRDFQYPQSARLSIVDIGRNLAADMEREAQARAAY